MLAVRPDSVPYFYGRITRENAEHIILDRGSVDGMYLLRSSNNLDSDYVISMCFNKQVLHYRIEKSNDDLYFLCGAPQEKYHGPIELVENTRILPCKLLIPCIKPLHVFMPGVNCGITDDKLQEAIQNKSKEWGLSEDELNSMLEDKESDIWKMVLKSLHESEVWFHGKINRPEAEKRLAEHGLKDGTFLIREHDECSFSMSLCHSKMVKHYKIDVLSSGEVGIQDGPRFDNIISLVSHYSVFSDGLWCTLQQPCDKTNLLETTEARLGLSNAKRKISSPIAAHRGGLMSKDLTSSLQDVNKNSKASSKPKDSSTSKGSAKKSAVSVWLKNPVAFLSRNSNDSKPTVKTNKAQQDKDKEVLIAVSATSVPSKKSTPPPVPKKLPTLSGLNISMPMPTPDLNLPTSPSFILSKDHNHNDCKPNEFKQNEGALPSEAPSSPCHISNKLDIRDALNAHLSKHIAEQNLTVNETSTGGDTEKTALNLNEQVPIGQNHTSSLKKPKPMPFPRQKKLSCPTPPSRFEADVAKNGEQTEHTVHNLQLPDSGSSSPSLHSPMCSINGNAASQLLQFVSPKSDQCSNTNRLSTTNAQDDDVIKDSDAIIASSTKPPMSPVASPQVPSNVTNAFNLTSVISELKKHHLRFAADSSMSSCNSIVEHADSSKIPLVPENVILSSVELSNSVNNLGNLDNAAFSSEIKQETSDNDILKIEGEQTYPTDPLYEEIDPEYENNGSKMLNSDSNSAIAMNEVPTVPSMTYEDSKWEDSRNDESNINTTGAANEDPSLNNDVTSKFNERRKKFSKEQSEFHYKTIKRHRKGPETIDRKLICFQEKIGLGHFGQVMKATFKSGKDQVPCAVKTLKRDEIGTAKAEILREARIMTSLDHPHIVRLLGICEGEPFYLVMELAPLGSLNNYLKHNSSVPVLDILSLMYQVATGMEYLESKQFVHRDLAARNVLLVNESFAKISDFGMSKALGLHAEYYMVEPKGKLPLKWYAPECIYFFKFSTKSDVWSFGITLWEALSYGGKPYLGMAGQDILKMFSTSKRLACPKNCPKDVYQIMLSCWEIRPEMRPSFSKLSSLLKECTQVS